MSPKRRGPRDALVGNASDKAQVDAAKETVKTRDDRFLGDLKATLGTERGRRVLAHLLDQCGAFRSAFSSDALQMAYNAGAQDVGHWLCAQIVAADAPALMQLQTELYQEKTS